MPLELNPPWYSEHHCYNLTVMILVTGGTGFIGRSLVNELVQSGEEVRTLLRPSKESPKLPLGVPVESVVCSLTDEEGLRAALRGVKVIYHLAGNERSSTRTTLDEVDITGTNSLLKVAKQTGVRQIIYLSHLGADRNSAYPVLKAKGYAENNIILSGIPYTIIRSAVVFGRDDQFTTSFARQLKGSLFPFLLPGEGQTLLQPIWINDITACLSVTNMNPDLMNRNISVGGVEMLPFRGILRTLMKTMGIHRLLIPFSEPYLRYLALLNENLHRPAISIYWLDYLSADRTTNIDTLPRYFGILPARFESNLKYLKDMKLKPQRIGTNTK